MEANARFALLERARITAVAETPYGAHPTSAAPDYHLDLKHIKSYVESAATPEAWEAYQATYLSGTQADYVNAVGGLMQSVLSPSRFIRSLKGVT